MGIPLVLEGPGLVFGTFQTFRPGASIGLNPPTLKLERCNAVELQGANTTWVCTGASGSLFDRIESGGLSLGRLIFAVHQRLNGRDAWVESLDSRDWQLLEAFWFCRSAIGGSADQDIVGGPAVPAYYGRAQCITDSKLGGCFGSLDQSGAWQVTFWANPQGGIHPDSRLTVDQEMHSGKRWEAGRVPFL
jgi:hypothetical protein